MVKLLTRTGATVQTLEMIYKAVEYMLLIYESDLWVVTVAMLKVLEGFQHPVARQIVGKKARRMVDRKW